MSPDSPLPAVSPTSRPISLPGRIFSFPAAVASLLVVLAVLCVRARFDDPDLWWHLKVGQVIWTTHHVPLTDLFSFTTNHHAWIPHEWLSQLTIFASYHWGGYPGLMLWMCVFSSAIFIAGYALCSLYSGNAKVGFLGALAVFVFSTVGLSIRPQLIGYLLLLFELIFIHLGRSRSPRWFYALPPLFALWINCHGSFFLGLAVAGAFLVSSFVPFEFGSFLAVRWAARTRNTFFATLAVSLAALFLNPAGLKQVLYPLDTLLHQPVGLGMVQEWQPTQFNGQRGILLLLVLAVIFLLVATRNAVLYLEEFLLLAAGVWLAASHDRLLFVFGILAAPILARMLASLWDNYDPSSDRIWPNAVLIGLSLLVAWLAFPSNQSLIEQIEAKSPVQAVQFIQSRHLTGPMMNDYTDGGYLIWAAPEHPVFVDGRGDVFEWAGVLEPFNAWSNLQSDPNALLDRYKIQFCLLNAGSPIARVLALLPNWKIVYSDNLSVILVRTTGK